MVKAHKLDSRYTSTQVEQTSRQDAQEQPDAACFTASTQLTAQAGEAEHSAQVETLKAQIAAGTYHTDSQTVARRMLKKPLTVEMLGIGQSTLPAEKEQQLFEREKDS